MGRYIIYGAGAIGGVLGATLFESGQNVTLVARGAQLEAIERGGLRLETPEATTTSMIPVVAHPREIAFGSDDVVLLTVKSHDSQQALDDLARSAPSGIKVFCVQNGVENERIALRLFTHVYGVMINCPAVYLTPGVVSVDAAPLLGLCELGEYPDGIDDTVREVTQALNRSRWSAVARDHIVEWKYAKLLDILSNAVQLVAGLEARTGEVARLARNEGVACLEAAGVRFISDSVMAERRRSTYPDPLISTSTPERPASTYQSVARGNRTVETDYLNGEIVLIGRLAGFPTPVNALLQVLARAVAEGTLALGSLSESEILERLPR